MAKFSDCVLLTRVGGFYESYFHQAPQLASILGIKLANRRWAGQDVGMAGFPAHQLEKYLKTLVIDKGLLVAISEEYRSPTLHNEKADIQRRVQRVVSAGTLMDEKFVDPFRNNFVLAISRVALRGIDGAIEAGVRADPTRAPAYSTTAATPTPPPSFGYGLAWLDVGTADFSTTTCADLASLRDEIARVSPREIVLEPRLFGTHSTSASAGEDPATDGGGGRASYGGDQGAGSVSRDGPLEEAITVVDSTVSRLDVETDEDPIVAASAWEAEAESGAVRNLVAYLRSRLLDHDAEIDALTTARPMRLQQDDHMQIDAHTLSALEVKEVAREGGVKGSLFSVMRRTVTKGGTRLLQQWLATPSTSLSVIEARLALVELFLRRPFLRDDLRSVLRLGAGDISRVLQRLITRRNNEQDLLEVRDFIQACDQIVSKLQQEAQYEADADVKAELAPLVALGDKFKVLTPLGERLGGAIDERVIEHRLRRQEAIAQSIESTVAGTDGAYGDEIDSAGEGGKGAAPTEVAAATTAKARRRTKASDIDEAEPDATMLWGEDFEHLIRPSTSKTLTLMTKTLEKLRRDARKLEAEFKAKHGEHISLRFVLGQGFVVHARGKAARDPERELHVAGKLRSTHTYYSERWTLLGGKVHKLIKEMKDKEALELEQLRQDVLIELAALRWNAKLLDQLDVLVGYGQAAQELGLVRPQVDDSLDFDVRGGRHLSVEMGLLEQHRLFAANDLRLSRSSFLHLITGPNMGGKSTFLRQNAMIAILAQAGSFVPAHSARIGIVDRVFSRVGAKDDLFRDRSTFMVEMMETSEILRRATERSLVIADEIGRGTTTEVGLAVAFATLHHLYAVNRCRTLFATHFHEVADMLGFHDGEGDDDGAVRRDEGRRRFAAVDFFCTDVTESEDGSITYSHLIRPGVNRESHGLKVAKLAEMPQAALDVAAATLDWLRHRRDGPHTHTSRADDDADRPQGDHDAYEGLYNRLPPAER
ncbi:related to MSH1 - DNA mismatch repair protein, mitochondrial [Pseudozyma flocculosa]|nr:related to MSH1 - DNA mismatch repair protein, mitochondrial [Pseudozyma flocculosa]